jgi:predicted nucleic acid-binding protein
MILIDTNVLVALADKQDGLNRRALDDMEDLVGQPMFVAGPVLTETYFFIRDSHLRQRLAKYLDDLAIAPAPSDERHVWEDVATWLEKYADHDPDWADGCLAVLCGRERRFRVWTYDREFRTVWRRPDGTKIPLAVK